MNGKPILKFFVRIRCLKTLPLGTMMYKYPQEEPAAIDAVWICCRPYAATNHPFQLYSYFLIRIHNSLSGSFQTISVLSSFLSILSTDSSRLPVLTVHLHCSNRLCDIATLLVQSFTISPFDMYSLFFHLF